VASIHKVAVDQLIAAFEDDQVGQWVPTFVGYGDAVLAGEFVSVVVKLVDRRRDGDRGVRGSVRRLGPGRNPSRSRHFDILPRPKAEDFNYTPRSAG
jgi:hypothetical protein